MNRVSSQFEKFYFVLGSHGKRRSLNFESSKEREKSWDGKIFVLKTPTCLKPFLIEQEIFRQSGD